MTIGSALHRYATPVTVGLFLVSAVSGTALFLHLAGGIFHEMHEWLSMVLLVPFGLHMWKNWAALMGYLRRGHLLLPVSASLLVAAFFAAPALTTSGARGGNPAFQAMQLILQSSLTTLAPILHATPEGLRSRLQQQGYVAASTSETPASIAGKTGAEPEKIWVALISSGEMAR